MKEHLFIAILVFTTCLCSGEVLLPAQINNNVPLTNQEQQKLNPNLNTITSTEAPFPLLVTNKVEDIANGFNPEEEKEINSKYSPEPRLSNATHLSDEDLNYGKTADEQDVKRLDAVSVKVLVAQDDAIGVVDLTTDKRRPNFLNVEKVNIYSVDYHWNKSLVFFATNTSIYRYNYHNQQGDSALNTIVSERVGGSTRLAVDWIHDKLYWICHKYQTVEMADLDGRNRRLLADNIKTIRFPNNIVVDPFEKKLFFVSNFTLFEANLDGSKISRVRVDHNFAGNPGWGIRDIAIDRVNKVIFTTGKTPKIQATNSKEAVFIRKINYDGTFDDNDQKNLLINTTRWMNVDSLDVFHGTLYFAHYEPNKIDEIYALNLATTGAEPQLKFVPRSSSNEPVTLLGLAARKKMAAGEAEYDRTIDGKYSAEAEGRGPQQCLVASLTDLVIEATRSVRSSKAPRKYGVSRSFIPVYNFIPPMANVPNIPNSKIVIRKFHEIIAYNNY